MRRSWSPRQRNWFTKQEAPAAASHRFGGDAGLVAIKWGYSPFIVIAVNGFFFAIDCIFFAANSLMLTWRAGVKLVEAARGKLRQPEEDLIETAVNKCHARLSGTAVFLASSPQGA